MPGSWRYPSLQSRHIDDRAGGRSASPGRPDLGEDVIGLTLLILGADESLRLQVEHRSIAAALGHQLVVRPKLHNFALFEHANAVGLADGGETVRDEDRGALPTGSQNALEDFRLAADIELRSRLIEQHDARAKLDGAQRPGQSDPLPLASRKIGTAFVALRQDGVEAGEPVAAPADSGGAASTVASGCVRPARRCRGEATRSG